MKVKKLRNASTSRQSIFRKIFNWNFIFRKRYWIGIGLFAILVIGGFHGSSVSIYNDYIQPNIPIESSEPILGETRSIRSDEWSTSTPTMLSQIPNHFEENSKILNGYSENVTLYPGIVAKSPITLARPNQLGFLFLPEKQAFSFYWFFGYFLLFFASLEFLMIITKQNRLFSVLGAILITFAPAVQWWEHWNIIAYGEIAIVLFSLLLKNKKLYQQILLSLAIGYVGACYIMCMYPAWQIPYGYFFLILAIWVIKINKNNCSVRKFLILFTSVLLVAGMFIIPAFAQSYDVYQLTTHTAYPGARSSTGGKGASALVYYFSNIFLPFKDAPNASEASQFISLFPIPIVMGVYYWFSNRKRHKKDFLLAALVVLSILLCVWTFIPLPGWLAKITLISMSTPKRSVVTISYVCLILLIYCLNKYSDKQNNSRVKYQNLIIAVLTTALGIVILRSNPLFINNDGTQYMRIKYILIDFILFVPIIYLCILNHPKTNKIALLILAAITFISGVTVHPISNNLDALHEKPVAKEIQKIESIDSDANWLVVNSIFSVSNYTVANGADTINSTNYYPNFQLWRTLGLEDQEQIFNRYAHIPVDISNKPTSLHLRQQDLFEVNVNNDDVCKTGAKYLLVQDKDLDEYDTEKTDFVKLYDEDNFSIFRVDCK